MTDLQSVWLVWRREYIHPMERAEDDVVAVCRDRLAAAHRELQAHATGCTTWIEERKLEP